MEDNQEEVVEFSPAVVPAGSITIEKEVAPDVAMATAKSRANVLMSAVTEAGLAYNLGGKKAHLGIEAWQILGKFDNATPRLVETTRLSSPEGEFYGYEAKVEVVKNGQVISSADAMCTRDEDNWNRRGSKLVPEFQLRSMAQTRAASKALRMAYGWIAVLAGYSATPAEEMVGDENQETQAVFSPAQPAAQPAGGSEMCEKCGAVLVHKSGTGEKGPWSGWFCPDSPKGDRTHTVKWE